MYRNKYSACTICITKYTPSIQKVLKDRQEGDRGRNKKQYPLSPTPYSELIQFTKPIKDMGLTSTYNLTHSAKAFINDSLIACSVFSESSKVFLFLSIQSV